MNRKMRRMFGGLAAASFLAAGFVYAQGWQASDTNRRFQNQQQSDQGTGVGRLFRSDVQEAHVEGFDRVDRANGSTNPWRLGTTPDARGSQQIRTEI